MCTFLGKIVKTEKNRKNRKNRIFSAKKTETEIRKTETESETLTIAHDHIEQAKKIG